MNIEHRTSNIEYWMGKDEETEFKTWTIRWYFTGNRRIN